MLQSINYYEDMGVVEEFTSGTALVGSAPTTGLWPAKFTPLTMSISELHEREIARCQSNRNGSCYAGDGVGANFG